MPRSETRIPSSPTTSGVRDVPRAGTSDAHSTSTEVLSASHGVVGSKPASVTAPLPEGSIGGDRAVAVRGERARDPTLAEPARAGSAPGAAGQRAAQETLDRLGVDVDRHGGPEGEELVGEPGEQAQAAAPAHDREAPAAREPRAQGRQLLGGELTRVDVLPDQAIERGPGLGALGQVGDRQLHDRRLGSGRVAEPAECGDEGPRPLGDDADHELPGIMERERDGPAGDHRLTGDERDLQRAAERRRLGVEGVGLARRRREVDRHGEARSPLGAPDQPKLACERRAVVGEVDPDRHPRAGPGVALDQRPGLHRHPRRRARRGGWGRRPGRPGERRPARRGRPRRTGRRAGTGRGSSGRGARHPSLDPPRGRPAIQTPGSPGKLRSPCPTGIVGRGAVHSAPSRRASRGAGPPDRVPVPLEVACPRSARSVRCATTPRRCPISLASSRRPMT